VASPGKPVPVDNQYIPVDMEPEPAAEIPMIYTPSYFADESEMNWTPASHRNSRPPWVSEHKKLNKDRDKDIMQSFWSDMQIITKLNGTDEWYMFYDEIEKKYRWPDFKQQQLWDIMGIPGQPIIIEHPSPEFTDKSMPHWIKQLIYNIPVHVLHNKNLHTLTSMEALQDLFSAAPGIQKTPSGKVYLAMVEVGRRYHILDYFLERIAHLENLPNGVDVEVDYGIRATDQHIWHRVYPMPMYFRHPVLF
jgi:hypothetical protein